MRKDCHGLIYPASLMQALLIFIVLTLSSLLAIPTKEPLNDDWESLKDQYVDIVLRLNPGK